MSFTERDYSCLVALGALGPALDGLRRSRDLLLSIDHPAGEGLADALRAAAIAQDDLQQEIVNERKSR